jgi:predicted ester cyclase
MSTAVTEATLKAYGEQLLQRGPYGQYFVPDVTFTLMGANLEVRGAAEVEQFIRFLHEQAFDAQPELKNTFIADGRAALEAVFIGTHTGEFMGVAATGRRVEVPYAVFYELAGEQITALRAYLPMDTLMRQLGASAAVTTAA